MKNKYGLTILDTCVIKNALKKYYNTQKDVVYDLDIKAMLSAIEKVERIQKRIMIENK